VQYAVLGAVLVDGRSPPGAIERALLARLLVAPGVAVPAEELIEAAWPHERRAGAAGSLRVRLARLRAFLEPDRTPGTPAAVLVRDPAGYRLAVGPDDVDAQRFCRLAERGACDEALALWRGEPFGDLDAVEVARAEARRLHAVRDTLRQRRAARLAEAGRLEEAVAELEALAAEDPLREEPVRELMHALYRAGRHADALDAYRRLARALDEIGLQPGPAVRELEALVLRHELVAPDATSPAPSNLRVRVTSVVGRDDDVALVQATLFEHRIVTLVGPGGVGKTTLAAEVARARPVPGGSWLVELAPLQSCDEVVPAAATVLGLRRVGEHDRDALAVVCERLRETDALLVLDGGEHLIPGLGDVARRLASCASHVSVLVTSRRPLGLPGEAVVPVPPLEEAAAHRLFEERARAARPGLRLDSDEVAAVCSRLDGLPLALELAAGRLRALPARAIAERLHEGLAVLGRGTLDASIAASHGLLSPAEQELYRRLSVFAGAFDLEDAEAVAAGDGLARADVLELLVGLVDHSMVHVEDEPRRYRLLESLRIDARNRLDAATAEATARRHASHMARLAMDAADLVWADGAEAAGEPLIPRRADLEAAFSGALEWGDAEAALGIAAGLEALHHRLGTVALAVECGEQALALGGGSAAARLSVLGWHAAMLLAELRVPDAQDALARARDAQRELRGGGSHAGAVAERHDSGLRLLEGQIALCRGDLDAAERALDGLVEPLVARREWFTAATAAWALGSLAQVRGDLPGAIAWLRASCDHFAACEDVCSLDGAAADLAEAATIAGLDADATAACEFAIGFAPERPLGERNTHLLHQSALAATRASRADEAARYVAEAAVAARRDPVVIGPWHAPAAAGDVSLFGGDADTARERYCEARELAARIEAERGRSLPAGMYLMATELRLAQTAADSDAALAHARAALEHAQSSGAPAGVGAALAAIQALETAVATE
jgi:predicted ATPase/DNA-binding SARP family transcriptional activator